MLCTVGQKIYLEAHSTRHILSTNQKTCRAESFANLLDYKAYSMPSNLRPNNLSNKFANISDRMMPAYVQCITRVNVTHAKKEWRNYKIIACLRDKSRTREDVLRLALVKTGVNSFIANIFARKHLWGILFLAEKLSVMRYATTKTSAGSKS